MRNNTMKKLNITKERFEKSRYFIRKYGTLEYVSESGRLYKTSKGQILKFNESHEHEWELYADYLGIPGTKYLSRQGSPGFGPRIRYKGVTFSEEEIWSIAAELYKKEFRHYPDSDKVLENWIHEYDQNVDEILSYLDERAREKSYSW